MIVLIILGHIVLGCFLEGIGILVLITVPVFQRIVTKFGYVDLVRHHRGGDGRGRAHSASRDEPVRDPGAGRGRQDHQDLSRDVPFLIAPLILIVLLFLFPGLVLWLPKALYG